MIPPHAWFDPPPLSDGTILLASTRPGDRRDVVEACRDDETGVGW